LIIIKIPVCAVIFSKTHDHFDRGGLSAKDAVLLHILRLLSMGL